VEGESGLDTYGTGGKPYEHGKDNSDSVRGRKCLHYNLLKGSVHGVTL
jgi:hypothetical protein